MYIYWKRYPESFLLLLCKITLNSIPLVGFVSFVCVYVFNKSMKMLYKWNNMPLITQESFFFAHVIWILLKWKPLWKYSKNIIILNMFHPCWIPSFDLNLFAESVCGGGWTYFCFSSSRSFPFFLTKGSC